MTTNYDDVIHLIIDTSQSSPNIKPYSTRLINNLSNKLLFITNRKNGITSTYFASNKWYHEQTHLSINFIEGNKKIDYELKALTLSLLEFGNGKNSQTLKWSTVKNKISKAKRVAKWLITNKINCFSQLNSLSLNELTSLLSQTNNTQPSFLDALANTFNCLINSGILTKNIDIYCDYISLNINNRFNKATKQQHSIIPNQVLASAYNKALKNINLAKNNLERWIELHNKINDHIPNIDVLQWHKKIKISHRIIRSKALTSTEVNELEELQQYFEFLKNNVLILVLITSGMRNSEALSLEDGCVFEQNAIYYITSTLSKGQTFSSLNEWVIDNTAFEAVTLLTKVNQLYRERAKLILTHLEDKLIDSQKENLKFGIENKNLFNIKHVKYSTNFNQCLPRQSSTTNQMINRILNINLTSNDINELENYGCNFQSINGNNKNKLRPYKEGMRFNFTAHQFRHTFATRLLKHVSENDLACQMKHDSPTATQGYTRRERKVLAKDYMLNRKINDREN